MAAIAFPSAPIIDTQQPGEVSSSWRYFFMALLKAEVADAAILAQITSSIGAVGYQKLPGGFIRQWGNGLTVAGGGVAVGYAIAFPSAVYSFQATITAAGAPLALTIVAGTPTTTFCNVWCANSTTGAAAVGTGFFWEAIGK